MSKGLSREKAIQLVQAVIWGDGTSNQLTLLNDEIVADLAVRVVDALEAAGYMKGYMK